MSKVNISAVVVAFNEAGIIARCLSSLDFCDEIIVVDLGSTDNLKEAIKPFNATYVLHEKVPIVELVYKDVHKYSKHSWLLLIDPDEIISTELKAGIVDALNTAPLNIGTITVPWQFYYRQKKLNGTVWGGISRKMILVHQNRYMFSGQVHEKGYLKPGFENFDIADTGNNYLHHYWMTGYRQLTEKHRRYISKEGERMFTNGVRYSMGAHIKNALNAFRYSFFIKKGYVEGLKGIYLSAFWMWYVYSCWKALEQYQSLQNKNTRQFAS